MGKAKTHNIAKSATEKSAPAAAQLKPTTPTGKQQPTKQEPVKQVVQAAVDAAKGGEAVPPAAAPAGHSASTPVAAANGGDTAAAGTPAHGSNLAAVEAAVKHPAMPATGTISAATTNGAPVKQEPSPKPSPGDALDVGMFLDEEALLAASTFPIPPEQLIAKAKDILSKGVHRCQEELADDFVFTAPFIGPLNKAHFAGNMETLQLDYVFPDMQARIYHVRVDPLEPNRVWLTTRPVGHQLGYLRAGLPVPKPPTGKLVELPPQTSSLLFHPDGKVAGFTMGYVMDRRLGNTGGLGGAFGLLHAIGVDFPYPEGKPWQSSWQQMAFTTGGNLARAFVFVLDRVGSLLLPNWLLASHGRNVPCAPDQD